MKQPFTDPKAYVGGKLAKNMKQAKIVAKLNEEIIDEWAERGLPTTPHIKKDEGRPAVTKKLETLEKEELRQARNEEIRRLADSGMSRTTILRIMKKQCKLYGRPPLTSHVGLGNVLTKLYANSENMSAAEKSRYDQAMKELSFGHMDMLFEKITLMSLKWEKAVAEGKIKMNIRDYSVMIDIMQRIKQNIIDNRNWNASRMNPNLTEEQQENFNALLEEASNDLAEGKNIEGVQELVQLFEECMSGEVVKGGD